MHTDYTYRGKSVEDMMKTHESFVTVTEGVRGFFCIMVAWHPETDDNWRDTDGDGYYEVEFSGFMSGDTPNVAIREGKNMARDHDVEFVYLEIKK